MAERHPDHEIPMAIGRAKYPWAEWFDGGEWTLRPGQDFDIPPFAFRGLAFTTARRRGLRVRFKNYPDGRIRLRAFTEDQAVRGNIAPETVVESGPEGGK